MRKQQHEHIIIGKGVQIFIFENLLRQEIIQNRCLSYPTFYSRLIWKFKYSQLLREEFEITETI